MTLKEEFQTRNFSTRSQFPGILPSVSFNC
jgi:hypothetical protein